MMLSADMVSIYENGYKTVIQSLNYAAMRIDEKDYTGLIINEITSEIGITRGLQLCSHPIKLVLTCKQEYFYKEKVHFDCLQQFCQFRFQIAFVLVKQYFIAANAILK